MKAPRTLHDIRGASSLLTYPGPPSEEKTYVRLTVLARERQRLLAQQESWQRRLRRVTSRVAEIDTRSERLRGRLPRQSRSTRLRTANSVRKSRSGTDQRQLGNEAS